MSTNHDLIESKTALLDAFRPRDRKNVIVSPSMKFPLSIGHYLTWSEPSGVRVYLVFKKPSWKYPIGVAFRRDQGGAVSMLPRMCDWCHSTGASDEVSLLTASVDSKTRIGAILCMDLGCLAKMESIASISHKDPKKLIADHQSRMVEFCSAGLGLVLG